jgi:glucokinase-like ROK family protein
MSLTRAAITTIVNELVAEGLVYETVDGVSTAGRRPVLLEINPSRGYLVGFDIGATHLGILVTDFASHIIYDLEKPFDISLAPPVGLEQVADRLQTALTEIKLTPEDVVGIGVGVPGPVVVGEGTVSHPPIMPGWDNYPIKHHLQELWHRPVTVNNDAELGALGEWAHGAGRDQRHMAYIKVGTGIGAGLLLDGKIYRGAAGTAGEIGHMTIQDDGPLCTCGNYGCLEALAGGRALAQQAREAVSSGKRTQLSAIHPVESISARDVASAARRGDLVAQQIIAQAGSYLGVAIASLINIFNPGMVVIGGGLAQLGDLLLQPIRQTVQQRSLSGTSKQVHISTAVLGRRSTSMGAVVQVLNTVLDQLTENQ